jgi:membrane-associated phospholipid phosphatase
LLVTVADSDGTEDVPQARQPAGVARFHPAFALAGAVLLALAAGFAAVVAAHPRPLTVTDDRGWLSFMEHTREPFLTTAAKLLSLIGGPTGGTVIVAAIAAFLWFVGKRKFGALFLIGALALTSGCSQLIKHLVLRPRPPDGLVHADIGSFPSGHVITTLAVGSALTLVLARPHHRRIPLAVVAAATLVMIWCRTYLGEHWLSDTLESILVSGGIVLTGWAFVGPLVVREAGHMLTEDSDQAGPGRDAARDQAKTAPNTTADD